MGVKARIWYPNSSYHITTRGNRRSDIFKDGEDFEVYLAMMQEALEYFNDQFELICYCLMDNHVHLLLYTKEQHLKYFIARVNSIYAKYFNKKHNYIGHLYQDRYFSEVIESDAQMLETSRYVHLNPFRAGMVEKPEDYKWSSYAMYIGEKEEKLISSEKVLCYFNEEDKRRNLYRNYVERNYKLKYTI